MKSTSLFPCSFLFTILLLLFILDESKRMVKAQSGTVNAKNYISKGPFSGYGTYKINFSTFSSQLTVGYISKKYMSPFDSTQIVSIPSYYYNTGYSIDVDDDIYIIVYNSGTTSVSYSTFTAEREFKSVYSAGGATIPYLKYETFKYSGYVTSTYKASLYAYAYTSKMSYLILTTSSPPLSQPTGIFKSIALSSSGRGEFSIPPVTSAIYDNYIYLKCETVGGCGISSLSVSYDSSGGSDSDSSLVGVIIGPIVGFVVFCIIFFVVIFASVMARKRRLLYMAAAANSTSYVTTTVPIVQQPTGVVVPPSTTTTTTDTLYSVPQPQQPYPYGQPQAQYVNPNYTQPQQPYYGNPAFGQAVTYSQPTQPTNYYNPGAGVFIPTPTSNTQNNYGQQPIPAFNPNVDSNNPNHV